jgi:glucose-6-phosphate isomerase
MYISNITTPANAQLKLHFESLFEDLSRSDVPAFLKVLERSDLIQEILSIKSKFDKASKIVVIGIGGSSLGAKALSQIFYGDLLFLENVDASAFFKTVKSLPQNSHFIIVSKSGSTLETLAQLNFLYQMQKESLYKKSVVITEKKSSLLYDWATKNKIPVLEVPFDLGGRFSVLSAVGLYPAAFLGVNLSDLQNGARDIYRYKALCAEYCAQMVHSFDRNEMVTVLWTYSDQLRQFGLWFQQLWSESLGKSVDLNGRTAKSVSTILPLVGTNDQHSVLQQISDGQKDKFVVFVRNLKAESDGPILEKSVFQDFLSDKKLGEVLKAQYEGTQRALAEKKVQSITIQVSDLSEKNVGLLLNFFMMSVAMLGKYHNINTFDQPGVEYSKKIAVDLLKSKT